MGCFWYKLYKTNPSISLSSVFDPGPDAEFAEDLLGRDDVADGQKLPLDLLYETPTHPAQSGDVGYIRSATRRSRLFLLVKVSRRDINFFVQRVRLASPVMATMKIGENPLLRKKSWWSSSISLPDMMAMRTEAPRVQKRGYRVDWVGRSLKALRNAKLKQNRTQKNE